MKDNMTKMIELLRDEALAKELFEIKNSDEALRWLSGHGIEISADELRSVSEKIKAEMDGELSEEDLRSVAGGFTYDDLYNAEFWLRKTYNDFEDWVFSWF